MTGRMDYVDLRDGDFSARVLSYGARLQFWRVGMKDLVLGYDSADAYLGDPYYMGAVVGRVANRIGAGAYQIDGSRVRLEANEGANQLHGGPDGLSFQMWDIKQTAPNACMLRYESPHGESGFPGRVAFWVEIALNCGELRYELHALCDVATPISLCQHNYFRIGEEPLWECRLQIAGQERLKKGPDHVATGEVLATAGTRYDFREPVALNEIDPVQEGYDDFFIWHSAADLRRVAQLRAPCGSSLTFCSDQPGGQIYTSNGLGDPFEPLNALCVEPSGFPNALNCDRVPSVIQPAGVAYKQRFTVTFRGAGHSRVPNS